ncbi:hopanoid-associated sugar epimerase [Leptolyngbya sp. FACHB-261]|uniref:hopanoid-associated sugar epimerase n=1 Tax=Leptolyngbya sp. FACHB-261 TaxID=2692806 RepID=UPI0016862830|nr:hopanoid-associated sugar epimerase [Leptolyngbya sp. FACHB-261]MBD2099838.1 NAD-dependent epimerase/dehydratase family protein [Leptolyngbya sp. FACHB-261]
MRTFVTGGTGFIGANVVRELLSAGHQVRALVRPKAALGNLQGLDVELVTGNLLSPDLYESLKGCDALFHVAAHYSLAQADRDSLYRSNVEGTRNILAAARRAGVERSVYTSSVAAIGVPAQGQVADESHQTNVEKLVGHYKKSKFLAEQVAQEAAAGQHVVIVNPSSPLGPWDAKPTPTGDIVLRFLRGQMPFYLDTGLNFVHVRDVAQGHLLALERGKSGERYILGHENLSLKALLDRLEALTGLRAPQRSVPHWLPLSVAWLDERLLSPLLGKSTSVPIDGVRMSQSYMYYSPAKAVRELGLPQTPLDIALKDAVAWFVEKGYCQLPQSQTRI